MVAIQREIDRVNALCHNGTGVDYTDVDDMDTVYHSDNSDSECESDDESDNDVAAESEPASESMDGRVITIRFRRCVTTESKPAKVNVVYDVSKANQQGTTIPCTVCMQDGPAVCMIPCGHTKTCLDCAQKAMQTRPVCPICRETVTSLQQVFL